jgi:hypothetical protein
MLSVASALTTIIEDMDDPELGEVTEIAGGVVSGLEGIRTES